MSTAETSPADHAVSPPPQGPHARFVEALPLMLSNLVLSRNLRMAPSLISALLALIWIDWTFVAGFIALVFVHECVTFPYLLHRVVTPMATRDPRGARYMFAFANSTGAILYTCVWAPVLVIGGVIGALVGSAWFWGTLIHNMTYNSRDRLVFVTCMIPPVTAAVVAPFFMDLPWWGPWVALSLTDDARLQWMKQKARYHRSSR